MSRFLYIAFILIFLSCSNKNTVNQGISIQDKFTIDTVLSDYSIKVTLTNQYLKKGLDNEMMLNIKSVPNEHVAIFTKTSEATVKLNNDNTGYLILPKITADSVGIHINKNIDGKMTLIGKIYIRTE